MTSLAQPTGKLESPGRPRGLNVIDLHLEKEDLKEISPALMTAFKNTAINMQRIKQWSEKIEAAMVEAQAQDVNKQQRLGQLESNFEKFQKQVQFLFVYTTSLFSRARQSTMEQASQLQRHAEVNSSFISQFCGFFGVKTKVSPETHNATTQGNSNAVLASGLEVDTFSECFARWQGRKNEEERQTENVVSSIQELRIINDRTRERMLAWRDTVSANAHLIEALTATSTTAQNELQLLKAQNVPIKKIESMIQEALEQWKGQVDKNMKHIEENRNFMRAAAAKLAEENRATWTEMEQRFEQHGVETIALMKKNIAPMNAYLNSMHVRTDAMQQQLKELDNRLPELEAKFLSMVEDIRQRHDDQSIETQRSTALVGQLRQNMEEQHMELECEKQAWAMELKDTSKQFHEHLEDLSGSVEQIRNGLQSLEKGRFEKMTHALRSLDQKVTTWIGNNSLPAKISEARLYALESKLNEEAKSRFKLESRLSVLASASTEIGESPLPSMQSIHGSPQFQSVELVDSVFDPNCSQFTDDKSEPVKRSLPGIDSEFPGRGSPGAFFQR